MAIASARSVSTVPRLEKLQASFPDRLHLVSLDVTSSTSIQGSASQAVPRNVSVSCIDPDASAITRGIEARST